MLGREESFVLMQRLVKAGKLEPDTDRDCSHSQKSGHYRIVELKLELNYSCNFTEEHVPSSTTDDHSQVVNIR